MKFLSLLSLKNIFKVLLLCGIITAVFVFLLSRGIGDSTAQSETVITDQNGDSIINIVDARIQTKNVNCLVCYDLTADGKIDDIDEKKLKSAVSEASSGARVSKRFDINNDDQINDLEIEEFAKYKGREIPSDAFGLDDAKHLSYGYTARQLTVGFYPGVTEEEVRKFLGDNKLKVTDLRIKKNENGTIASVNNIAPFIATVTTGNLADPDDLDRIAKETKGKHPKIKYVEKDLWGEGPQTTNDPNSSWGLDSMRVKGSWLTDTGGHRSVKVAVIDTGIETGNSEFSGRIVDKFNAVCRVNIPEDSDCDNVTDSLGHGTKMASIIGAAANNSVGIAGIAHNVSIMPIRVATSDGYASSNAVGHAVDWATEHGADVINMSINSAPVSFAHEMMSFAWDPHGIMMFAATGNCGTCSIQFPADHPDVHGVGAYGKNSDGSLYLWAETARGSEMNIVAPGVNVKAVGVGGTVSDISGTSPAAAHASGVAALLKTVSARSVGFTGFIQPLESPLQISGAWTIDSWATTWYSNCFRYDFVHDHKIDVLDAQTLAFAWGRRAGESNYNPRYELIPIGGDGFINAIDVQWFFNNNMMYENCPAWHLHQ